MGRWHIRNRTRKVDTAKSYQSTVVGNSCGRERRNSDDVPSARKMCKRIEVNRMADRVKYMFALIRMPCLYILPPPSLEPKIWPLPPSWTSVIEPWTLPFNKHSPVQGKLSCEWNFQHWLIRSSLLVQYDRNTIVKRTGNMWLLEGFLDTAVR